MPEADVCSFFSADGFSVILKDPNPGGFDPNHVPMDYGQLAPKKTRPKTTRPKENSPQDRYWLGDHPQPDSA